VSTDYSQNDAIILGIGNNDTVSADISQYDTITLGNGAGDTVQLDTPIGFFQGPASQYDTVTLGNGAGDAVDGADDSVSAVSSFGTIRVGNGAADVVTMIQGLFGGNKITLGDGNGDVVNDNNSSNDTITVGKGNDTVHVGNSDTITVGAGHDSFMFEQTTAGNLGVVTINGFNPSLDAFTFSSLLTTAVSYQDNAQGNAVINVDNAGDTITLVGVHSSALMPSDFHFV
jgi:hypothetical protein